MSQMKWENKDIIINRKSIGPGEVQMINLNVGRLPSGTRISIKAKVYRSTIPGPTILILGGVHGDEINGIEIVRKCVYEGYFDNLLRGTVIAIPVLNVYGFINFSRDVPDGKDVNRSFPGNMKGSLAAQVARTLTKHVLPHMDFGLDFHTGGSTLFNYPQLRYTHRNPGNLELAKIFATPFILRKSVIPRSLRKVVHEMGKKILVYEAGEALRLDGYAIEQGIDGIKRVLHHYEMKEDHRQAQHQVIHITKSSWLRANRAGLFMWTRKSGGFIQKNEPMGYFRDKDGNEQSYLYASRTGYIVGHNNSPVVNQGDALFNIGYEWEELEI